MELKLEQATHQRGKNWIARITGTDPKFGLQRVFLRPIVVGGQASYELADGGVYEVAEPRSLGKTRRYFIAVEGVDYTVLTPDEVMARVREMEASHA